MKDLKNIKGAKTLSKMEQRIIKGGLIHCRVDSDCPDWLGCHPVTHLCSIVL
jgi:hypothetical protein